MESGDWRLAKGRWRVASGEWLTAHRSQFATDHSPLATCQEGQRIVQRGMNVLALVKGSERYVFLYDDASPDAVLQTIGRYAADPELSFTWYDAAVLSQKVRKLKRDAERDDPHRFRPSTP